MRSCGRLIIPQPRDHIDVLTARHGLVAPEFFPALPEARDPRVALLFELGDDLGVPLVLGRKEEPLAPR